MHLSRMHQKLQEIHFSHAWQQLCPTSSLQPRSYTTSSHTRCQKMALKNAQLCSWVCQPNKADDVSLWLLLYQLITLGKLQPAFCTLLTLGLLIRYSSSVL